MNAQRDNDVGKRSQKGVVTTEYLALLSFVTILGAASIAALGVPLVRLFRYAATIIALPMP